LLEFGRFQNFLRRQKNEHTSLTISCAMVGDRLLPPDGGTKLEFLRRDGLVLFGWIFLLLPRYGENNKLYFPLLFPLSPPPPPPPSFYFLPTFHTPFL
jgi:hypothetical protein